MTWVDLSLVCLFLWGGVSGYLAGWKRTAFRLGAMLVAVLFAMAFKSDMSRVIGEHYPLEQSIKEVVDGRLVFPVGTIPLTYPVLLVHLGIPRVLCRTLLDHRPHEPVDFIQLSDRLTSIMTDLIAFIALFVLWWVVLNLFGWIYIKRPSVRVSLRERWLGTVTGMLNQLLVISLLLGALSPVFWLIGLDPDLTVLEKGPLARIGLQLFKQLKIP